jgi:hypothetical protein
VQYGTWINQMPYCNLGWSVVVACLSTSTGNVCQHMEHSSLDQQLTSQPIHYWLSHLPMILPVKQTTPPFEHLAQEQWNQVSLRCAYSRRSFVSCAWPAHIEDESVRYSVLSYLHSQLTNSRSHATMRLHVPVRRHKCCSCPQNNEAPVVNLPPQTIFCEVVGIHPC